MSQIAKDFGISEVLPAPLVKRTEIEDAERPGLTLAEQAEIRELKKHNRLLEQENGGAPPSRGLPRPGSTQNDLRAGP